jgi:hypothetical protein
VSDNYLKLDSGESVFFDRELETIRAKTYDVKFQEPKLLNILPISMEGDPTVDTITHRVYTRVGIAKMGGTMYATDFPPVDVYGTEISVKVKPVHNSYGYNKDEIMAAMRVGKPLESMRANAARKAMDMKLDEIARSGETATGLYGLFNYPGISEYAVPATGTGTSKLWTNKTSDQILTDLFGIQNYIVNATNGIEVPDVLALPLEYFNLIATKRLDADSEETVLSYFLRVSQYVKRVEWFAQLATASSTGGLMMVAWKNDSDHLVFDMPLPFTQEDIDRDGLRYVVPCRAKTAGVTVFYPKSVAFGVFS